MGGEDTGEAYQLSEQEIYSISKGSFYHFPGGFHKAGRAGIQGADSRLCLRCLEQWVEEFKNGPDHIETNKIHPLFGTPC